MKRKTNKNLILGGLLVGIMLCMIAVGFFWTPYDPEAMDSADKLAGVSFSHLMGCDNFGRDIFSRVLKGSGTTLFVAVGTVKVYPSLSSTQSGNKTARCQPGPSSPAVVAFCSEGLENLTRSANPKADSTATAMHTISTRRDHSHK